MKVLTMVVILRLHQFLCGLFGLHEWIWTRPTPHSAQLQCFGCLKRGATLKVTRR